MDHSEMNEQLAKELLESERHDLTIREQLLKEDKLKDVIILKWSLYIEKTLRG